MQDGWLLDRNDIKIRGLCKLLWRIRWSEPLSHMWMLRCQRSLIVRTSCLVLVYRQDQRLGNERFLACCQPLTSDLTRGESAIFGKSWQKSQRKKKSCSGRTPSRTPCLLPQRCVSGARSPTWWKATRCQKSWLSCISSNTNVDVWEGRFRAARLASVKEATEFVLYLLYTKQEDRKTSNISEKTIDAWSQ